MEDFRDKRFGKLKPMKPTDIGEGGAYNWLCYCDCGNNIEVNTLRLELGEIAHCGCETREDEKLESVNPTNELDLSNNEKDITGDWFGNLQAIKQSKKNKNGKYLWLCLCSCGRVCEHTVRQLESGRYPDCGCKQQSRSITPPEYERPVPKTKPLWMTDKQLRLLMLIVPGPIGSGMTVSAAARHLHIEVASAFRRLQKFKMRFPVAWNRVVGMLRTMSRHRLSMREDAPEDCDGIFSYDELIETHGQDVVESMVKHKF